MSNTSFIILITIGVLIIVAMLLWYLIPIIADKIRQNKERAHLKQLFAKCENKYREIMVKADIYKEDKALDKMVKDMPWLENDVREYRELRTKITGIEPRNTDVKDWKQDAKSTNEATWD